MVKSDLRPGDAIKLEDRVHARAVLDAAMHSKLLCAGATRKGAGAGWQLPSCPAAFKNGFSALHPIELL